MVRVENSLRCVPNPKTIRVTASITTMHMVAIKLKQWLRRFRSCRANFVPFLGVCFKISLVDILFGGVPRFNISFESRMHTPCTYPFESPLRPTSLTAKPDCVRNLSSVYIACNVHLGFEIFVCIVSCARVKYPSTRLPPILFS